MKKNFLLIIVILALFSSCNVSKNEKIEIPFSIKESEEFSDISIVGKKSILEDNGINIGDSVDIMFSDGKKLEDIPYYTGFYCKTGETIVINYPHFDEIRISVAQSDGAFNVYQLDESVTGIIKLREKGKYKKVEEAFKLDMTTNREDYDSDEMYANFREIKGGNLKENFLYRGCSPIDNKQNRANCTGKLIEKVKINTILNLANDEEGVKNLLNDGAVNNKYYNDLFVNNNVISIAISAGYQTENYKTKVAMGLRELMHHEPPYYIHCLEGKDRTGFLCILLEALSNFSYEEIENDYMLSYCNFYKLDKNKALDKYNMIVNIKLLDMLYYLLDVDDNFDKSKIESSKLKDGAINYLISAGLSREEIAHLIYILNDSGDT